jgi:hypothetical protein
VSRYSILPAPPTAGIGVASIPSSVSPSPFAPPSASAPPPQLPPVPSSSSSLHVTAKAKSPDVSPGPHPDRSTISGELDVDERLMGSEYVMEITSTSASRSDDGEAGLGRNLISRHLDTPTLDPPDQLQARAPSIQVCLSSRAVFLSACVCIRVV